VRALHQAGFAWYDAKLENILVGQDFKLKICDVGMAQDVDKEFSTVKRGTMGYMAPEMHSVGAYSGEPCDIFSLGVVLFTMHFYMEPWTSAKTTNMYF